MTIFKYSVYICHEYTNLIYFLLCAPSEVYTFPALNIRTCSTLHKTIQARQYSYILCISQMKLYFKCHLPTMCQS